MKKIAMLAAAALLALGLAACVKEADEEVAYQQVCVTEEDLIQVDAFKCEFNGGFGYIWYWYPVMLGIQQNGYHHTSGYKTKPAHGRFYTPSKPYVTPVKPVTPPKAPAGTAPKVPAPPAPKRK